MAAQIGKMQQRARALPHQRHLYQWIGVRAQLRRGDQAVCYIAEQAGVRGQAQLVVEAREIPGNPRDASFSCAPRHDGRNVGVFLIHMHQFRRPDHGGWNER